MTALQPWSTLPGRRQQQSPEDVELFLDNPAHRHTAAVAVTQGRVLGYGFGNFYGLACLPQECSVQALNRLKGRPASQVGSVTTTPSRLGDVCDWTQLPVGLSRGQALEVIEALLALGPFGFRAPAAPRLPRHLTQVQDGVRTTQVISPGAACLSNAVLDEALELTGGAVLHVTSANRSRHVTGADEEPAHCTAAGLYAEFGTSLGFVLLRHRDEAAVRSRYPAFAPMSTSVLALHRVATTSGGRPALVLERQGSLPAEAVRAVLQPLGHGLVVAAGAMRRLPQRDPDEHVSPA